MHNPTRVFPFVKMPGWVQSLCMFDTEKEISAGGKQAEESQKSERIWEFT